ncbi:MAG: Hdr-like menaquinol oxidoreductase cytochrome c subunit [Methylococcales bacterium]|jgi:hypothetical protein|nr:Hdr-like menaquinol oxidoreductase cytochrome c subunit [Methylococcales bacterium]MBT7444099.1 Hdr-like menaquinol oxidoreductase cytochrome c subunit [Methylococcales bacterium]
MAALVVMMIPFASIADDKTSYIGKDLGKQCVIPIADGEEVNYEMRANHMKHLLDKRDKTMHLGVRTEEFSLKGCIDCHATVKDGKPVKVNAPGEFCAGCHKAASVKLDCFECHATVPSKNSKLLQEYLKKHSADK